jgi:phosphopantothenoylcysteine synthetase/decarboxylase
MPSIEYLITAGGTREPLDEVRYIGNLSTGRLGAAIAEEAFRRGHRVRFIHGQDCRMPSCARKIALEPFTTTADLKGILERRVSEARPPAVLVHAAAVADYTPARQEGKVSSDREEWIIHLKRTEKLVDSIKRWNPSIHLVKFKLESNRTRDELLSIGSEAGRRSEADWVVANDTREISEAGHFALIIHKSGEVLEARGKQEIAKRLLEETDRIVPAG